MLQVVFLDRDGVINVDTGYVSTINKFTFLYGAIDAMRQIRRKGYEIIVVTNQSGIGRGLYTEAAYWRLRSYYHIQLLECGVTLLDEFYCPHAPEQNISDQCECRKPNPGMIEQAVNRYSIDASSSYFVGDKMSDMEAAARACVANRYLVSSEKRNWEGCHSVGSLFEFSHLL